MECGTKCITEVTEKVVILRYPNRAVINSIIQNLLRFVYFSDYHDLYAVAMQYLIALIKYNL